MGLAYGLITQTVQFLLRSKYFYRFLRNVLQHREVHVKLGFVNPHPPACEATHYITKRLVVGIVEGAVFLSEVGLT